MQDSLINYILMMKILLIVNYIVNKEKGIINTKYIFVYDFDFIGSLSTFINRELLFFY